jgi:transcriptional regulator with PAS, ATPase and Fis domain
LSHQEKKLLETILESAYERIVVVDAQGYITMINQTYADFLGIKREEAIGRHVTEVIENTRMHIVAQTGVPELGQIQYIKGTAMVCTRLPIEIDGKIVGAVGKAIFNDLGELNQLVEKVNSLQKELEYYKDTLKIVHGSHYTMKDIIGLSKEMQELKLVAYRVAQTGSTVLIRGESGTGKELFAQAIHEASPRRSGPFLKVNCAAIPENLLESELFGYEEGAFTGAKRGGRIGKFELAQAGTIFLDEIGDMPSNMQAKLLRVLQEKEIERVGGNKSIPINVRVIAATNRNLEDLLKRKVFREDLYYRLNVVELKIPALRDRRDDIPYLVEYLLEKLARKMGISLPKIDKEALEILSDYHYPGNIRELENILERTLNFIDGDTITAASLPVYLKNSLGDSRVFPATVSLKDYLEEAEKIAIRRALEISKGNKNKAAQLLQMSRSNFYLKLEKYKIK